MRTQRPLPTTLNAIAPSINSMILSPLARVRSASRRGVVVAAAASMGRSPEPASPRPPIGEMRLGLGAAVGRTLVALVLLLVFTLAAPAPAQAQCVGASWSALGSGVNGTVNAFAVLPGGGGEVIVGGSFNRVGGIANIAWYNPTTGVWSALGSGTDGIVYAVAVLPSGDVIVGGSFTTAGGVPANDIARYNPTTGVWSALGTGVTGGVITTVYALAVLPSGDVIVGGQFTAAGGVAASGIARYNPTTGVWSALGLGANGQVHALAVLPSGDVIVGGNFNTAGSVAANNIARYNPTTGVWSALGSGTNSNGNIVYALAVLPSGDVIVGGNFTTAGGAAASNIARYNPTTGGWSALGSGTSHEVDALAVLPGGGGDVIVGGKFIFAGGVAASRIARYNPTSGVWSVLRSGTSSSVNALAVLPGGDVIVGGGFTTAGGVPANSIARYNFGTLPTISDQPQSIIACPGGSAAFTVSAFDPAGGVLTYQWRKDAVPINSASALTASLTLSNVQAADVAAYDCVITGPGPDLCSVPSTAAMLSLTASPITTQPANQAVCAGTNVVFTVAAQGSGLTYRWSRALAGQGFLNLSNNAVFSGTTTPTLTITGPIAGDANDTAQFRCRVTTSGGCGFNSQSVSFAVAAAPVINVQPSPQTVCAGTPASFSITATGALSYQWRKGAVAIDTIANPSAATATLTLASAQAADVGSYDCIVSNGSTCGSPISTAAALTVDAATIITAQPAPQTVCAGTPASLSITATDGSTLTYQWRKGGDAISAATNPSAVTATLSFASAQADDAATYDCIISNGACGSTTSTAAALGVNAVTVITAQPSPQTVCAGTPASFSITATGAGTLAYQWRKGGIAIDTIANPSAATSTLTIASAQAADVGSYDCIVSGGACGSPASTAAALGVNAATVIGSQPVSVGVCTNSPASFSVTATGTGTLTYQWRKASVAISAATNPSAVTATLSFASAQAADAATYDCIVTSPTCGSVTSSGALLVVGPPVVTLQPTNQLICPGDNVVFTGAAVGSGVTYRWARALATEGFLNLSDNATFSGTTTPTLTIAHPAAGSANDTARFRLRCFSACGNTDATIVTFDVLSGPPVITVPPVAQSACTGGSATLSVTATGDTLSYQWRKGATAIDSIANPSAATATLTLSNVQQTDAVSYDCIVTNACGTVTSSAAAITIIGPHCQPADIAFDTGDPLPPVGPCDSGLSNSGVNEGDYNGFFQGFFDALPQCDIADDAGNPLPPFNPGPTGDNTGVNEGDYNCFFQFFFQGCP